MAHLEEAEAPADLAPIVPTAMGTGAGPLEEEVASAVVAAAAAEAGHPMVVTTMVLLSNKVLPKATWEATVVTSQETRKIHTIRAPAMISSLSSSTPPRTDRVAIVKVMEETMKTIQPTTVPEGLAEVVNAAAAWVVLEEAIAKKTTKCTIP